MERMLFRRDVLKAWTPASISASQQPEQAKIRGDRLAPHGRIKPVVWERMSLAYVVHAHALIGQATVQDKIVLVDGKLTCTNLFVYIHNRQRRPQAKEVGYA